MSGYRNQTFDDRDTDHLKYQGSWTLDGSYNASHVGETGTLSSTKDLTASVTFVCLTSFPLDPNFKQNDVIHIGPNTWTYVLKVKYRVGSIFAAHTHSVNDEMPPN
jgi:hypothetical protein